MFINTGLANKLQPCMWRLRSADRRAHAEQPGSSYAVSPVVMAGQKSDLFGDPFSAASGCERAVSTTDAPRPRGTPTDVTAEGGSAEGPTGHVTSPPQVDLPGEARVGVTSLLLRLEASFSPSIVGWFTEAQMTVFQLLHAIRRGFSGL